MNEFTDMGAPSWQTVEHKWLCFERDCWTAWTPHLREVVHAEVSDTNRYDGGSPAVSSENNGKKSKKSSPSPLHDRGFSFPSLA